MNIRMVVLASAALAALSAPAFADPAAPASTGPSAPASADQTTPATAGQTASGSPEQTAPAAANQTAPASGDEATPAPAAQTTPAPAPPPAPSSTGPKGWYLGLAAGFEHTDPVHIQFPGPLNGKVGFTDSGIYLVNGGYKFDSGLRTELEIAYKNPGHHRICLDGCNYATHGGADIGSAMVNFLYDWALDDDWGLSFGGGVGAADVNVHIRAPNGSCYVCGAHTEFAWQGIVGGYWEFADDLDLTLDVRYRQEEVDHDYRTVYLSKPSVHVFQVPEMAALIGLRWYLGEEPPPPPPPPAPPPPPPPAPPPPTKTFIVFFDFDKASLTSEAQAVVTEAVKTAKENGFVKVIVTGHTDTVGSDDYNQALSVRRAEAVKDEMQRQGMDAGSIAIEGKSFHDPLVQTGPGVREPQNRRAVIDLGS